LTDSDASYISPLKYSDAAKESDSTELATVSIRYKKPDQNTSRLVEFAVGRADITPFSKIDENTQFAIAVSGFAALLRESDFVEGVDEQTLLELAVSGKGEDRFGYRAEFAKLIRTYYALHPSIY